MRGPYRRGGRAVVGAGVVANSPCCAARLQSRADGRRSGRSRPRGPERVLTRGNYCVWSAGIHLTGSCGLCRGVRRGLQV